MIGISKTYQKVGRTIKKESRADLTLFHSIQDQDWCKRLSCLMRAFNPCWHRIYRQEKRLLRLCRREIRHKPKNRATAGHGGYRRRCLGNPGKRDSPVLQRLRFKSKKSKSIPYYWKNRSWWVQSPCNEPWI